MKGRKKKSFYCKGGESADVANSSKGLQTGFWKQFIKLHGRLVLPAGSGNLTKHPLNTLNECEPAKQSHLSLQNTFI